MLSSCAGNSVTDLLQFDETAFLSRGGGGAWPDGKGFGLRNERSGVRSSLGSPSCILEQGTFSPKKDW